MWVGGGAKIANVGGVGAALVEHLWRTKPAVVRWPGGCFADSYNWRDGADGEVKAGGPTFRYRFAPASVTRLRMSLV